MDELKGRAIKVTYDACCDKSKYLHPEIMNLVGFVNKNDRHTITLTHEKISGTNGSVILDDKKRSIPIKGLPFNGQRTYRTFMAITDELPLNEPLNEEESGLEGKIIGEEGQIIHLIKPVNGWQLNILGYLTHDVQYGDKTVRISHIDPHGSDFTCKRLPIFTDYIPFVNAKHGDKTFALREFNKYRIIVN